jgi:hypothetical protein
VPQKGQAGLGAVVEDIPLLRALRIRAGLDEVHGLDEGGFPVVGAGAQVRGVQAINEGFLKELMEIGTSTLLAGILPTSANGRSVGSQPTEVGPVGLVLRMLDEQGPLAHVQFFITAWIRIMNLAATQRVAVEQIHVDEHGQVRGGRSRCKAGAVFVGERQRERLEHLRRNEIGSADDIRRDIAVGPPSPSMSMTEHLPVRGSIKTLR